MIDNITNITPYTLFGGQSVCELNQIAMLNQMEKMPVFLFIFIALTLFGLIMHLYIVPRFKNKKYYSWFKESFLWFGLGTGVWALLYSFTLTFTFPEEFYNTLIYVFIALFIVVMALYAWKNKTKLLGFLKDVRKDIKVPKEVLKVGESGEVKEGSLKADSTVPSAGVLSFTFPPPKKKEDVVVKEDVKESEVSEVSEVPEEIEGMTAWCMKCKEKKPLGDYEIKVLRTRTGVRRFASNKCPVCGTKLSRMLGRK